VRYRHALETAYWLSHIAFWSAWGKQGPITRAFRSLLDSPRGRESRIVSALDDIGNRILPKSIVVYSRKPLRVRSENGHVRGPLPLDEDERRSVEVRAVPAPFDIQPPPVPVPPQTLAAAPAPLSLTDELRAALALPPDDRKQRLLELMRSCRFAFMREVQDLAGEQASTPWTPDGRSLKEILAHITAWERWTVVAMREIEAGIAEPAIMQLSGYPDGISRFGSIDAFNAARMAEARERPWADVIEDSAAVFERLIAAAERTPASSLAQTAQFYWPDIGGTVPCGIYLLMVAAFHYQEEHLNEVARAAR
jgi:hypothetical protein